MDRISYIHEIDKLFITHKIVALLGPRQVGKTTLAKLYAKNKKEVHFFDLEDYIDLARLDNPKIALESLQGLIVIDEVQFKPDLFPVLRVIVDSSTDKKFLILGSASKDLINKSAETLAGRIAYIEVTPFGVTEAANIRIEDLWQKGGFPLSVFAETDEASFLWRKNYISTFLERDIPSLGIKIPALNLRRFWMMVSHYHANIFNASELARSLSINEKTSKNYLDILYSTFMIRQLQPWYENISKRQVKSPKVYFKDSGILHNLLNINNYNELLAHPKLGASWEGFALEEIIRFHKLPAEEVFFWSSHGEAEVDLLTFQKGQRIAYEFKYCDVPKMTKSISIALEDLKLDKVFLIYPGKKSFNINPKVTVFSLQEYLKQTF